MNPLLSLVLFLVAGQAFATVASAGEETRSPAERRAACEAEIKKDEARDEPKLTDEYKKECRAIQVPASPLQALNESGNGDAVAEETASANQQTAAAKETPDAQGLDLTPEQDRRIQEENGDRELRTERDRNALALGQRLAGMSDEERAAQLEKMRRSAFAGGGTLSRLEQLGMAEQEINRSARESRYANQAAAVETYNQLAQRENLTPDEQIAKQTMAAMAGEHAGRTERESGYQSEETRQALQNDRLFADAYKAGQRQPIEQEGVGGYFGQFRTAEPRIMENHVRGTCEQSNGNVPALPCGDITSGFGLRPISWSPWHNGQDNRAPEGAAIYGSAIGRVADVKEEGPGRVSVHVDHGNGFVTVHRHVAANSALSKGSSVDTNTQIGAVATAGTGPHKHTEIFLNGVALNTNNYNQAAYADHCTVGCQNETTQPVIASNEQIHRTAGQATRLNGRPDNGDNPTSMFAGGSTGGAGFAVTNGGINVSGGGFGSQQTIRLSGGQMYTPGMGGVGDGGMYDTAPAASNGGLTMSQPGGSGSGGLSTSRAATTPLPVISGPQPTAAQAQLSKETQAKCADLFEKAERAADLLRQNPECLNLLSKSAD